METYRTSASVLSTKPMEVSVSLTVMLHWVVAFMLKQVIKE